MSRALRLVALLIAVGGVIDPAVARQRRTPLPIDVLLPKPYDPGYQHALRVRDALQARFGTSFNANSSEQPRAVIAVGNVVPPRSARVPLLTIQDSSSAYLSAVAIHPSIGVEAQKGTVSARFHAQRLAGRSTQFVLQRGEARIAAVSHRWSTDEEVFDARFEIVPPATGVDVFRVTANTEEMAPVTLDVPALVSARRLRVLVYEPRPSWAAGFVRQALERDPAFELQARTDTSKGIRTETARATAGLSTAEIDTFDVIVAGGLDRLTVADLEALERFASLRGGTVVLLPDARISEQVRQVFDLPIFEEVLIERAVDVQSSAALLRASEFLLPKQRGGHRRSLAVVKHLGAERAAVISVLRGNGQLVISGLLDGWRYRADNSGGFDRFWRGAIADAALAAPPPVAVTLEPCVAPPGDEIRITTTVRETAWQRTPGQIDVPGVSASLIAPDGRAETIRLWPGATPGVYEATVTAPAAGRYSVRVESPPGSAETPLIVETSAAPVTPDHSSRLSALADSSGGGRFDSGQLAPVIERLAKIEAPSTDGEVHPMRSGWWMVPFATLLTAEWTLRRRRGQR